MQFGARDYIFQYLFSEVFTHQKSDVQQFLLRTAFVSRFCLGLGDALIKPLASAPIYE
jgi:ATP/maltotriose-dependent transcriptional regulator MalT